jgi:peptidoglycan hydrolase-like protein with peptidoglycan-binding domain
MSKGTRSIISGAMAAGLLLTGIAAADTFQSGIASTHAALAAEVASLPAVNLADCPTLSEGYQGGCINQLQMDLNTKDNAGIPADGMFGPSTQQAVIAFQRENHLDPADGIVGPQTKAALDNVGPSISPSQPSTPDAQPNAQAAPEETAGPVVWPSPGITHTPGFGWHDCGLIVGQQAFSYFHGPMTNLEPDGSHTVRGEVETAVTNGGCGVSATYQLQTKVCKKYFFYTSCRWSDAATLKYDDLPINGTRVTDQLVAPLRNGANTYRIEATVENLKNLEAESEPSPGIIGPSAEEIDQFSPEVVLYSS